MMILHYLGLDHIGHIEGPKGRSIPAKLNEMDAIAAQIVSKMASLFRYSYNRRIIQYS